MNKSLKEFKDNLSELDIDWQPFTSPKGTTRFFRKFLFSPEEIKSGIAREITDLGLKGGWEETPNGYYSIVVDVANLAQAQDINDLHFEKCVKPSSPFYTK
jgi:hypothetical protein